MSDNAEGKKSQFKLDISSTALEKGIDIAKDFLGKLIGPAVEEAGLLIKDQMTFWKFKNQVKILNKAKAECEKNNISTKHISLKLLCPLLDNCALEEDELLQDKWATLLVNLVDSTQNIENHVFPYILSQISKNEFVKIEDVYKTSLAEKADLAEQLETFQKGKEAIKQHLQDQIKSLENTIKERNNGKKFPDNLLSAGDLYEQKRKLEKELSDAKYLKETDLKRKIQAAIELTAGLEQFELSNLTRLGLIKEVQEVYTESQTLEIPNDPHSSHLSVKFEPDVYSNTENVLTDLGFLFLKACNPKPSA
jgi:hypothetical protein